MCKYCVISHTHWDREWYLPLAVFRLKLADLIDELINILEKEPDYIFHLDAQTVVIEDYLELKPQNRELLRKYIEQGNILIGPWYLQNDFYLSSGECTVRNLIEGMRLCGEFGGKDFVGYAPDQFGNISQLPQILNDFGIDNFIFGRGYNEYRKNPDGSIEREKKPSEFLWEGPDGSKLYAFFMAYWYNNAQRLPIDEEKIKIFYNLLKKLHTPITVTPNLLLMNGVDHLEPQDNLKEAIAKANERGYDVKAYTLKEYVDEFKEYVRDNRILLSVHKGELNLGNDYELLRGCWSSRAYLKRNNVLAEIALINRIEPLYAMLEFAGLKGIYPKSTIRQMWKRLLKMQAHDNICGCSNDSVHRGMEWEFESMKLESDEMIRRALYNASLYIKTPFETPDNYKIIVANTTHNKIATVARVEIEVRKEDGFKNIEILDSRGNRADYRIISVKERDKDIFSPLNLPGVMKVKVYTVDLLLKDILPNSFDCFVVKKTDAKTGNDSAKRHGGPCEIQNGFLKAYCDSEGLYLQDANTSKSYLLSFEDTADYGDSYVYRKGGDEPIYITKPKMFKVLENGELTKKILAEYDFPLPKKYLYDKRKRSKKINNSTAAIEVTLKKGDDTAYINYSVQNKSCDHRLRLAINCGDTGFESLADIPFDIIPRHRDKGCFFTDSKTHFCSTFAVSGDLLFFTEGIHEYEKESGGNILFTVLRATGSINRQEGKIIGGENWIVPENQCLRTIEGRLGMCVNKGYTYNQMLNKALSFRCPPLLYSTSCDSEKFMGGRTAVQDTRLKEFFYKKKKYADVRIELGEPVLKLPYCGDLYVSAFKLSEDGKSYVVRLFNGSDEKKTVNFVNMGNIYLSNMSENELKKINGDLEVGTKKIVTLKIF